MKLLYEKLKTTRSMLSVLLLGILLLAASVVQAQTVTTDKKDYLPGENVIISGKGFLKGETVSLVIEHLFFTDHAINVLTPVKAGPGGSIYSKEYFISPEDLGEQFRLTATGLKSGRTAVTYFTDGDFLNTIEIGNQQGYFIEGVPGSVTFPIIVTRNQGQGNFYVHICITEDFPSAFTLNFSATGYDPTTGIIYVPTHVGSATGSMTVQYDGSPVNEYSTWYFSIMGYVLPNNSNTEHNCDDPTDDYAVGTFQGILAFGHAPEIECPDPITVNTDPGICEATVNNNLTYISDFLTVLTAGQYKGYPEPVISYSLDNQATWTLGTGSGLVYPKGTNTVYLKASNGILPDATCSFVITVEDHEAPTFTAPIDITINKDADCEYDASLSITGDVTDEDDNCDDELDATYSDVVEAGSCAGEEIITRTWSLADLSGNTTTHVQIITAEDNMDPTFTLPVNWTEDKDVTCSFDSRPSITGEPTALWDNCDATPTVTFSDAAGVPSCPDETVILRTWKIEDNCGNSTTGVQTIVFEDNMKPTFTLPKDWTENKDVTCSFDSRPSHTGEPTALWDNCDATPTVTFSDAAGVPSCPDETVILRTWKIEDNCGNSTTGVQTIVFEDNMKPTFTAPPDITINKDADCEYDASPGITGDVTDEDDNCDDELDAIYSDVVEAGSCAGEEIITRTWSLTDDCGNTTTHVQIITAADNTAPLLAGEVTDLTFYCNETVIIPEPEFEDNCDDILEVNCEVTGYPDADCATFEFPAGDTEICFTAVDDCGNVSEPVCITITQLPCDYCTYTQGFYGSQNGTACNLDEVTAGNLFTSELLASGNLVIGYGSNIVTFTPGTADLLEKILPGGTESSVLKGACTPTLTNKSCLPLTKQGTIKNQLLAQTITLGLNLRIDNSLVDLGLKAGKWLTTQKKLTCEENTGGVEMVCSPVFDSSTGTPTFSCNDMTVNPYTYYKLPESVVCYMEGKYDLTVGGLYELANKALGNAVVLPMKCGDVVVTLTDIANAVNVINNAFDGCRMFVGYLDEKINCPNPCNELKSLQLQVSSDFVMNVFPNPFSDKLRFEFVSPSDTHARINLYDLTGRLVQTVFDKEVKAGIDYNADFTPSTNVSGMYFYRMTLGEEVFNGKVMYKQ